MNNGPVELYGKISSESDQMPGGTMFIIQLKPVGESMPGVAWNIMLSVSNEMAEHPLLARGRNVKVTITEG